MKYLYVFLFIFCFSYNALADCVSLGVNTYCKAGYYYSSSDRSCIRCPIIGHSVISDKDIYYTTDDMNQDGIESCRLDASNSFTDDSGNFQIVLPPLTSCYYE